MRRSAKNASVTPERAASLWDELPADKPGFELRAKCELVTPMYGGGVKAGEVDQRMPIRASAIRGQLRFWWRLLNAEEGKSSEQLFGEECELFGGIASTGPRASKVVVKVDAPVVKRARFVPGDSLPPYVLITDSSDVPQLLERFDWSLGLTAESVSARQKRQLEQAVCWWASFGGVGARTRRGLGAIRVRDDRVVPVTVEDVRSAGGRLACGPRCPDPLHAWKEAIRALARFRQLPDGRASGSGAKPGRSRWPEADTIRGLDGRSEDAPKHPAHGYYPRATFGLPIVFQRNPSGTLAPENADRMASPLILRPYFDGTAWRPAALLLPRWQASLNVQVRLDESDASSPAWPEDAVERRSAAQFKPMRDRADDPLTAFMAYFEQQVR